ncbi:NAD-dependent epimerase/dehydratase family protein [Marinactinospora thermotolerans]|uniref:Nucleoside-diphosphate-sugar epimerase n=1 Tax=Marinactinospora thermotolerans DSM 45154 TaxID=1122192 RepID=A0A1T4R9C1_9ACTN|nr:NAD(P)-dependent oxidoreductase [Marinactinospora thermotolerans]SKA12529.1 Nucleoside-diphosphate-sugar epimerase [Marinactinospora thermotolerans DSM 45154]
MRIFAVGATGVLGRELVPLLTSQGHEVTVMAPDRLERLPDGVTPLRGDLLDPDLDLSSALTGHDTVVNLATSMPRSPTAPGAWETNSRVRTEGTRRLAEAVLRAGVTRVVQMSITMAFGDGGDTWLDEKTPFDPTPRREAIVGPVAELEATITALPLGEVSWTVLRGARFVGPGTLQDTHMDQLARGELRLPGDGRAFLSMVHVADFADAVVASLGRPAAGRILNVAAEPVRAAEYYAALAASVGAAPPVWDPSTPSEPPSQRVDSRAVRALLGWRPRRGLLPAG